MDNIKIMCNDDVNVIMHSQYSQLGEEDTQKKKKVIPCRYFYIYCIIAFCDMKVDIIRMLVGNDLT